ncbi:MAG: 3-dehydroquinate synthase [Oscillospiraceae bacterium]|nr:3-dehydroquinate synthase [Oscillospiraceae bacterium]
MKNIKVTASKSYDVLIGVGLLNNLGQQLLSVLNKTCKIAIISDSNVWPLYGKIAESALTNAGFSVVNFVFPAGESSKNADTYINILNFLAENHLTRSDAVLALGGGVTGDMTGFAAATFLRGIRYIQVPTSLLAMVDSSVGGKTAIDLPAGKNLVGAFYQPNLVLCDLDTLNTLPDSVFSDGCAEVIKYGVLYDRELFDHLSDKGLGFDREAVIARCVELKRNVVAEDEFDTGARQKLNLGHTIGHGVEAQSDFSITHGQAVAIGMAIVSKAGCPAIYAELCAVLEKFILPTTTVFSAKDLYTSALSDKKRSGGTVNLIIPREIGHCEIVPTPVEKLESFIEEGL